MARLNKALGNSDGNFQLLSDILQTKLFATQFTLGFLSSVFSTLYSSELAVISELHYQGKYLTFLLFFFITNCQSSSSEILNSIIRNLFLRWDRWAGMPVKPLSFTSWRQRTTVATKCNSALTIPGPSFLSSCADRSTTCLFRRPTQCAQATPVCLQSLLQVDSYSMHPETLFKWIWKLCQDNCIYRVYHSLSLNY